MTISAADAAQHAVENPLLNHALEGHQLGLTALLLALLAAVFLKGFRDAVRVATFVAVPYILLNLALSMVAAMQAPVIMMSQNRQSSKDRLKADLEYQVNLKAELEVAHLHEKTDRLYETLGERLTRIEKLLKAASPQAQ